MTKRNDHQRGAAIMKQGLLAFQYEQEKGSTDMTGLSGLMTYVELMDAAGLRSSVERHVRLRECGQGWTDSQIITSLILLNLAGGESVMDLEVLEKDAGLCRVLRHAETWGMGSRERRALKARWRVERRRSVPSESAVFRYLEMFHDTGEEAMRQAHRAFIPAPNGAMEGLCKVNADLVGFVQSRSPQREATLDMDACLVETHKQEALHSYKRYRAYQPLTTYWAEADQIVHSEFRDGNVPAGHQQLRVLIEALEHLPAGVESVMLRSDTAGYQQALLRYCAEGRDERFGVIEFAVGVDVTAEFRRAVSEVAEQDWQTLYRKVGDFLASCWTRVSSGRRCGGVGCSGLGVVVAEEVVVVRLYAVRVGITGLAASPAGHERRGSNSRPGQRLDQSWTIRLTLHARALRDGELAATLSGPDPRFIRVRYPRTEPVPGHSLTLPHASVESSEVRTQHVGSTP